MSDHYHVIIMGAGPAGLSSALALAKHPSVSLSPIQITILERRPALQTVGGAVHLTPLALRYLDSLGVGEKLRKVAATVHSIEIRAHRTGRVLGQLWAGADSVRAQRQHLVETMLGGLRGLENVKVIFGAKVLAISQVETSNGGSIQVEYEDTEGSRQDIVEGDILLGCDGIHSQVRRQFVEPNRKETYSGKCSAYAYADLSTTANRALWMRAGGEKLVSDTTMVSHGPNALLLTYFDQVRDQLYLAAVQPMSEYEASSRHDTFVVAGDDKERLKQEMKDTFAGGNIKCLPQIIDKSSEWFVFPVYMLPPGGKWSRGRALLLGDAAHAMPPMGESTGIAIEDGVLLAHVLSRRDARTHDQLFEDYRQLREATIQKLYAETLSRWNMGAMWSHWVGEIILEWLTWLVLKMSSFGKADLGRDVRGLELPD